DVAVQRLRRTLCLADGGHREARLVERLYVSASVEPPFRQAEPSDVVVALERMEERTAPGGPVDELDPQLERGLGRRHPFLLRQAHVLEERLQRIEARLADADRADRLRLHERYRHLRPERAVEVDRTHPPCGPSTDDHDALRTSHAA